MLRLAATRSARWQHANRGLEIANRELRRSNEDLEHFAYAASHDLQEPLRMILIFSQLLQESATDKLDETRARGNRTRVVSAATRMNQLIHDVLDYSKSGRPAGSWKVVDLDQLVLLTTATLQQNIEESGAKVEVKSPLPAVLGDESQLGQVVSKIYCSNALKLRSA